MTVKVATPPGVHLIQTPTFFPGVPTVNSYLIERPLTLVDGGLQTPDAWKAFVERIAAIGYRPEEIRRVLITHGHPDHYGLTEKVRGLSGAEIYVNQAEASKITEVGGNRVEQMKGVYGDFFRRLGLTDAAFNAMGMIANMNRQFSPPVQGAVHYVKHGDRIPFEDFELEVLYTPGHTLGIVCYYEPVTGFIFSSDHILEEISPNPVIELGAEGELDYSRKFRSLVSYLDQIKQIREVNLSCVMPGHGLPFRGHDEVAASLFAFYAKRQLKMWNVLKEAGSLTVHELGRRIFPKATGMQEFLVACELLGNLEVMESQLSATREFDGTHYRFKAGDELPSPWA